MTPLERYVSEWSQSQQEYSRQDKFFKSDRLEDIMNVDPELPRGKPKHWSTTQASERTDGGPGTPSNRPKYYPDISSLHSPSKTRGRRPSHDRKGARRDDLSFRSFSRAIDSPSSTKKAPTMQDSSLLVKQHTMIRDESPSSVKKIARMQETSFLPKSQQLSSDDDTYSIMKCFPQEQDWKKARRVYEKEGPAKVSGATLPNQVVVSTLDHDDVAESIVNRFPHEEDRMLVLKILKIQQEIWKQVEENDGGATCTRPRPSKNSISAGNAPNVVGPKTHVKRNQVMLTNKDILRQMSMRFPESKDRERVIRLIRAQQQIWNELQSSHGTSNRLSGSPLPKGAQDRDRPTSRARVRGARPVHQKPSNCPDGSESITWDMLQPPLECRPPVEESNEVLRSLVELTVSLAEVHGRLQETEQKVSLLQQERMVVLSEAQTRNEQLMAALSASNAVFMNLHEDISKLTESAIAAETSAEYQKEKLQQGPRMDSKIIPKQLETLHESTDENHSMLHDGETVSLENDEVIVLLVGERSVCQCCFEEIEQLDGAKSSMACSIGHHGFCPTCVKRYIEAWVYGESYPLKAVHFHDGTNESTFQALPCLSTNCSEGHFTHAMVAQVVKDDRVWEAYQEKIFRIASLEKDRLGGASILSPLSNWVDEKKEQANPPSDGGISSCQEEHSHIIEEAMTEAKVRRCPDCNTPFLKERGFCNKLRCPCCNAALCFVCRQKIPGQGYEHFCLHAYDSCNQGCGKCPLWTTRDEQDDQDRLLSVATDENNRLQEQFRSEPLSSSTGKTGGQAKQLVLSEPAGKVSESSTPNSKKKATRAGNSIFWEGKERAYGSEDDGT